jgi:hypothetical protein
MNMLFANSQTMKRLPAAANIEHPSRRPSQWGWISSDEILDSQLIIDPR